MPDIFDEVAKKKDIFDEVSASNSIPSMMSSHTTTELTKSPLPPFPKRLVNAFGEVQKNLDVGVGKGIVNTAMGVGGLIRKHTMLGQVIDKNISDPMEGIVQGQVRTFPMGHPETGERRIANGIDEMQALKAQGFIPAGKSAPTGESPQSHSLFSDEGRDIFGTRPQGLTQHIGSFLPDAAIYSPVGGAARTGVKVATEVIPALAGKGAQLGLQSGMEAATVGGLSKLTGQSNETSAANAAIAGTIPIIGAGLGKAKEVWKLGKESNEFKKSLPIVRKEMAYETGVKRTKLKAEKAARDEALKAASTQGTKDEIAPLQEEMERLSLGSRKTREALANESANQSVINARSQRALQSQGEQAKAKTLDQAVKEAKEFGNIAGPRLDPNEFRGQAIKSRDAALKQVDSETASIKKKLLEIPGRPENSAIKTQNIPTGKMRVGDEGFVPEIKTVKTKGPMEVDLYEGQAELKHTYDSVSNNIRTVSSQGSPGATALKDFYEREGSLTLEQALDERAALNKIGYHDADKGLTDQSKAFARMTAAKLNKSIQSYFDKLPSGKEEAKNLLEQFRSSAERKNLTFKEPIARGSAAIMRRGDATKLTDPVSVKSWMEQVDEPTRLGAKAQVVHKYVSKPEEFGKTWNSANPDVKKLWFTPEEIKRGDSIAKMSTEQIDRLAQQYKAVESKRAMDAITRSASIKKRTAELSQLQTNIDELTKKIEIAKGLAADKLKADLKVSESEYLQKASKLKSDTKDQAIELIKKQQAAETRIKQMRGVNRFGMYAAGATLGSMAYYRMRGLYFALMGQ
jgi:hypothetical protein